MIFKILLFIFDSFSCIAAIRVVCVCVRFGARFVVPGALSFSCTISQIQKESAEQRGRWHVLAVYGDK